MRTRTSSNSLKLAMVSFGLMGLMAMSGCQVSVGGQTLPSAYYRFDDVQYFAPGPEFKLPREAAALKEYAAEEQLQRR